MSNLKPAVEPTGRYSVNEAAAALGISRTQIYRLMSSGTIKYNIRKCNGQRYIVGAQITKCWEASYL